MVANLEPAPLRRPGVNALQGIVEPYHPVPEKTKLYLCELRKQGIVGGNLTLPLGWMFQQFTKVCEEVQRLRDEVAELKAAAAVPPPRATPSTRAPAPALNLPPQKPAQPPLAQRAGATLSDSVAKARAATVAKFGPTKK